jgi:hypothetical protein
MSTGASTQAEAVSIYRLSDLDEWEFYRIVPNGNADTAFVIGLRPHTELRQVEYEIWDDGGEAPRGSGSVACEVVGAHWATTPREPVVDRIVRGLEY